MMQRLSRVLAYCKEQHWELPATILEGITLVLLVFVQDVAFKESVIVCALLLFISFGLHGLAYRSGQCKVWPKVIELTAPVPFVAMIPPAFLHPAETTRSAFIVINLWFAFVEVVALLAGRNFMAEYLQDWNPKEVWGTPLLQRSAAVTAAVWIICQVIMALAQSLAVAFKLSIDTGNNVAAAVFVCYVMQLLPLLIAIVNTFAYPAWLKKKWGYVEGVPATCYPPPPHAIRTAPAAGVAGDEGAASSSGSSQLSLCSSGASSSSCTANGQEDVLVCIEQHMDSKGSSSSSNNTSNRNCSGSCCPEVGEPGTDRLQQQPQQQGQQHVAQEQQALRPQHQQQQQP